VSSSRPFSFQPWGIFADLLPSLLSSLYSICILSYLVLVAGFYFAPSTGDTELPEDGAGPGSSIFTSFPALGGSFGGSPLSPMGSEQNFSAFGGLENYPALAPTIYGLQWLGAVVGSLWAR